MSESMQNMINIEGISKAEILSALFNAAAKSKDEPDGYNAAEWLNVATAEGFFEQTNQTYFGTFHGRIMSISLADKDILKTSNYDKYNGPGAARLALSALVPLDSYDD